MVRNRSTCLSTVIVTSYFRTGVNVLLTMAYSTVDVGARWAELSISKTADFLEFSHTTVF